MMQPFARILGCPLRDTGPIPLTSVTLILGDDGRFRKLPRCRVLTLFHPDETRRGTASEFRCRKMRFVFAQIVHSHRHSIAINQLLCLTILFDFYGRVDWPSFLKRLRLFQCSLQHNKAVAESATETRWLGELGTLVAECCWLPSPDTYRAIVALILKKGAGGFGLN